MAWNGQNGQYAQQFPHQQTHNFSSPYPTVPAGNTPPPYGYPQRPQSQSPSQPQPYYPQPSAYPSQYPQNTAYEGAGKESAGVLITSSDGGGGEPNPSKKGRKWIDKPSALSSWRVGVLGCTVTSLVVLLVNVIATIRAVHQYGVTQDEGIGTMFRGSCETARRSGTYIHLGINALSTILLSCSNYCMQCLNAPTRKDVDRAHAQRRWVNIGVTRVSNLRWIGWKKAMLWLMLTLSSVPLHLLYNSAVFTSLVSNRYSVYTLPENQVDEFYGLLGKPKAAMYERLLPAACIKEYANQLVSARGDVALVFGVNASASTLSSLLDVDYIYAETGFATNTGRQPFDWICSMLNINERCSYKLAIDKFNSNGLEYRGSNLQYCLSETTPEKCSLQFSRPIMTIVIACNAVKLLCMIALSLLGVFNKESLLATVGDAVSSFMERPDVTLSGMCLATREDVEKLWKGSKRGGYGAVANAPPPAAKQWRPVKHQWFRATGWSSWIWTYVPALVLLAGVLVCLMLGIGNLNNYQVPLTSIPFGSVDVRAILSINYHNRGLNLTTVALVANVPQLVLSICYFMYNRLYTSMLLSLEYESFSLRRENPKSLRVSRPKGFQRSNYFLSLPYRYSIPLMVASFLLHWLFSQSLFLARVDQYSSDGSKDTQFSLTDCGYSPIPIIISIMGSLLLMAVGIFFGFMRRYRGTIPLVGSNSAAISAACLRPHEDFDGHLRHVTWGEFPDTVSKSVGHCSFTSSGTVAPTPERYYS